MFAFLYADDVATKSHNHIGIACSPTGTIMDDGDDPKRNKNTDEIKTKRKRKEKTKAKAILHVSDDVAIKSHNVIGIACTPTIIDNDDPKRNNNTRDDINNIDEIKIKRKRKAKTKSNVSSDEIPPPGAPKGGIMDHRNPIYSQ